METEKILYSINQVKEKLDSYGILYYDLPGTDSTIQLGGKGECDTGNSRDIGRKDQMARKDCDSFPR